MAEINLEPLRAYTDAEVCSLLGIKRTTLWEIRDRRGLIRSGFIYPGSRVRRTTERQLQDYLEYLSSAEATCAEEANDPRLGDRLDELDARRQRRRA